MKIAVYGGTGGVGTEIVREAVNRGHEVTVVSRRGGAPAGLESQVATKTSDLGNTADVLAIADAHDVVVISSGPSRAGQPHQLIIDANRDLIAAAPQSRIFSVGGAGSLFGENGRIKDQPGFPEHVKPEADTMTEVLEMYQTSSGLDWTVISPAPMISAGERTGEYNVALESPAGQTISREDFAVAILDEIENPLHRGERFTVAN